MRTPAFGKPYAEEILLPVRGSYVALTLIIAFLLNMLPLTGWMLALRPDFVALALLFWGIDHPRRAGFLPAFLLGLAMDTADGSLFGQHALAYTGLMFAAIALHRRIPMFGVRGQIVHVLGLLLGAQLIVLGVRVAAGSALPGWWYFLASAVGAFVWPLARHLLTMPLRTRLDPETL